MVCKRGSSKKKDNSDAEVVEVPLVQNESENQQKDDEAIEKIIEGFNLPVLELVNDLPSWEQLFKTTVHPLLEMEGGEDAAIKLLPDLLHLEDSQYLREVKESITESETLEEAFLVIQSLKLSCNETYLIWKRGEFIDDYFKRLLTQEGHTKEGNFNACKLMLSQLPTRVQRPVVGCISEKLGQTKEMSRGTSMFVLSKIKECMREEGIPCDIGCDRVRKASFMEDDKSKVRNIFPKLIGIFLYLSDVIVDVSLGMEYYTTGKVIRDTAREVLLQVGLRSIEDFAIFLMIFGGITFFWLLCAALTHVVIIVRWITHNNKAFRDLPSTVRVVTVIASPFLMAPVVIDLYIIYETFKGRDTTKYQPLLLTLSFSESLVESVPMMITNWFNINIRINNFDRPTLQTFMLSKGWSTGITPTQIISLVISCISVTKNCIKWILDNKRKEFIPDNVNTIPGIIPVSCWVFFSIISGTLSPMCVPVSLRPINPIFNLVAMVVTLVFVANATKKFYVRVACTLFHTCLLCFFVCVALLGITGSIQGHRYIWRYDPPGIYRTFIGVVLVSSILQLVFGLLVLPSPRIVGACCSKCSSQRSSPSSISSNDDNQLGLTLSDVLSDKSDISDEMSA